MKKEITPQKNNTIIHNKDSKERDEFFSLIETHNNINKTNPNNQNSQQTPMHELNKNLIMNVKSPSIQEYDQLKKELATTKQQLSQKDEKLKKTQAISNELNTQINILKKNEQNNDIYKDFAKIALNSPIQSYKTDSDYTNFTDLSSNGLSHPIENPSFMSIIDDFNNYKDISYLCIHKISENCPIILLKSSTNLAGETLIISGREDKKIKIYNLDTRKNITIDIPTDRVQALTTIDCLDSQIKSLVIYCGNDNKIKILDTQKEIKDMLVFFELKDSKEKVFCLELMQIKSKTSTMYLVICCRDKIIQLYQLEYESKNKNESIVNLKFLRNLEVHFGNVYCAKSIILEDDLLIASGGSE